MCIQLPFVHINSSLTVKADVGDALYTFLRQMSCGFNGWSGKAYSITARLRDDYEVEANDSNDLPSTPLLVCPLRRRHLCTIHDSYVVGRVGRQAVSEQVKKTASAGLRPSNPG